MYQVKKFLKYFCKSFIEGRKIEIDDLKGIDDEAINIDIQKFEKYLQMMHGMKFKEEIWYLYWHGCSFEDIAQHSLTCILSR